MLAYIHLYEVLALTLPTILTCILYVWLLDLIKLFLLKKLIKLLIKLFNEVNSSRSDGS